MSTDGKRIVQLNKPASTAKDGVIAIVDPILDRTVQISIQKALGAQRASMDWQVGTTYATGNFVLYNGLTAWRSLINSNIGNVPSEGTFWTQETISLADGITDTQWSVGLFTYEKSKIVYQNAQYYLQTAVPFKSTNIATEITNGDWASMGVPAVNFLDFLAQGSSPSYLAGRMWFDGKNFNKYDNIPNTSLQSNKEIVIDVHNGNGATLVNYTAVLFNTTVAGVPSVTKAQADTVANADVFGVTTHDIAIGAVGKVVTQGLASGDTSAWNVDDELYLSATVAGALTNVQQEISRPVAKVLIADTEVNGGSIYVSQKPIENLTAIGQARGIGETQILTTTPTKLNIYDIDVFELNTIVTQVGAGPATASISPAKIAAAGFYGLNFSISITGAANEVHTFEIYLNGVAENLKTTIDLSNNQMTEGSAALSAISQTRITTSDVVEMYGSVASGTSSITASTVIFNIKRLGIV